jgi:hypothetical protein
MRDNEQIGKLRELVATFEALDAMIDDKISKGHVSVLTDVWKAKREVKRFLGKQPPFKSPPDLTLKLKKIRDNYGYLIDRVIETLGIDFSQETEEDIDIMEALISEGGIYEDESFYRRRNEFGTLIVGQSLPEHFLHHFKNLRKCYCLGLFEATIIYCRSIVETGCFEALRRRGQIKIKSGVDDFREFSLKALMRSIKPFVYHSNWDEADKLIKQADRILHSKRNKEAATERQAYEVIKTTFAIIEELFR